MLILKQADIFTARSIDHSSSRNIASELWGQDLMLTILFDHKQINDSGHLFVRCR